VTRTERPIQPDSKRLGAHERRPEGGGLRTWSLLADEVGYYDGERRDE
jgi:hypothetical protein